MKKVAPLNLCPECDGDSVRPVDWWQDGLAWCVVRQCPNCEWYAEGLHTHREVEVYDDILDAQTDDLIDDLRFLMRSNFESEIVMFSNALQHDLIGPEDFGSSCP